MEAAVQATAATTDYEQLRLAAMTARDSLAAEAVAKAELEARVVALEAGLAGALTGLEVHKHSQIF
jgi:hypothetical protein